MPARWSVFRLPSLVVAAALVLAVGCGAAPRSGPSTSAPMSSSTVGSSSGTSTTGASTSDPGAAYVTYYKPNGSAHITSSAPLTMQASDFKFSPNTLSAVVGTHVVLSITNTSSEAHNITLVPFGVNATLPPGKTTTVSFTASKAGAYYFYCNLPGHAEAGMVGKITVS